MHLCDVLAGHGFDDKAMVVAGQEAIPKAALGVAVERSAPCQGVLGEEDQKSNKHLLMLFPFHFETCMFSES